MLCDLCKRALEAVGLRPTRESREPQPLELRFRALLTDSAPEVRFKRVAVNWNGEKLGH